MCRHKVAYNLIFTGEPASEVLIKRLQIEDSQTSPSIQRRLASADDLLSFEGIPKVPAVVAMKNPRSEPDMMSMNSNAKNGSMDDTVVSSTLVVSYSKSSVLNDSDSPSPVASSDDVNEILEAEKPPEFSCHGPENDVLAN